MATALDTVICATDLTDGSDRVLVYGRLFSRAMAARLVLCHVIDQTPPPLFTASRAADFAGLQRRRFVQTRQRLDQMLASAPEAMSGQTEVAFGAVAVQLRRLARRSGLSMVVTAKGNLNWLERLTRESVTGQLLYTGPVGLLAVNGTLAGEPLPPIPAKPILSRIVVGIDGMPGAQGALAMAAVLAKNLDAQMHLVQVGPVGAPGVRPGGSRSSMILNQILGPRPDKVKWVSAEGRPHEALVRHAGAWDADLVVVGRRRRSRLLPLRLQSTAWRIMGRAICPVLSVSPVFAQTVLSLPMPEAVPAQEMASG